jgi:ABC-2 type transport system ATP-binding protein
MSAMLFEIDHVTKVYKKGKDKANDNIHFEVYEGEILGLLGPNGAGKSTLIKQMVGQLAPTAGEIRYRGTNVLKQTKEIAQVIAFYSQEPHALVSLKAWEALYFTGRLRGMTSQAAMFQTGQLLDMFDMNDLRDKKLSRLSGGQKRMIGIGTALIDNAPVLIFDEPTNELDPAKRRMVWDIIQQRNKEGATILLVTHNVLEAEQVVDRVAVVNHGKLLAIDHVSRLKQKVDQRLKFEITVEIGKCDEVERAMKQWGSWLKNGENRLRLLVDKSAASSVLDFIVSNENIPIMEYSIVPPSLEDVYFHIDQQSKEVVVR